MRERVTRRAFVTTAAAAATALAGCSESSDEGETTTEATTATTTDTTTETETTTTTETETTTTTGAETTTTTTETTTPDTTTTTENPAMGNVQQTGNLELTSPAFDDGDPIPEVHGYDAGNVNPPLSISGVPDSAETLTLVVDDPDAVDPAGEVWLHWLVWNIPASTASIPEDWSPSEATEGINDFGERGWGGPAPPDTVHAYRFKLFALDTALDVPQSADKQEVGEAMRGHVLAQTQLRGTYAPPDDGQ